MVPIPLVDCTDYIHYLAEKCKIRSYKDLRGVYFLLYCHDPNLPNLYRIGSGKFKSRLLEHLKTARSLGIHHQVYISSIVVLENLKQQVVLEWEIHYRAKQYRVNHYHLDDETHYHNEFFKLPDYAYKELLRYANKWTLQENQIESDPYSSSRCRKKRDELSWDDVDLV